MSNLLDKDGYPTGTALKRIRHWPATDLRGLVRCVHELWYYPAYSSMEGETWCLSTGGWSGNESIIEALRGNVMFWTLCWRRSERGGHYTFDLSRLPATPSPEAPA